MPEQFTAQQQACFDEASRLISAERASDLVRLSKWKSGGVLAGQQRPPVSEVSPEEKAGILKFWNTLPDSSCWFDAITYLSSKPRTPEEER
jgi:hypothetical protein